MDDDTLARARERLAALRALPPPRTARWAGVTYRANDLGHVRPAELAKGYFALPALLDVAEMAAGWREADERMRTHDASVERMDAAGEAAKWRAALDAALARLAGEA